jgi:large subunit ribosomal protein L6
MSRIGKRPVPIPPKVTVEVAGQAVKVKGPKGELSREFPSLIEIIKEDQVVRVNRRDDSRPARQLHGLCRTLLDNMVVGVSKGFERRLEIQGVGYRASLSGRVMTLSMGYSHPVEIDPPPGIVLEIEDNAGKKVNQGTLIVVNGVDKELVGSVAAKIRSVRPPEVYKGKGIRYKGEYVRRKAGKTGKK